MKWVDSTVFVILLRKISELQFVSREEQCHCTRVLASCLPSSPPTDITSVEWTEEIWWAEIIPFSNLNRSNLRVTEML